MAASTYADSNFGAPGPYTLTHTIHPCPPPHSLRRVKPVLSEEVISGTHGITHKGNVSQYMENKYTTRKVNIIKSQEKYQHMKHMVGTREHSQRTMPIHTVQQMDRGTS